VYQPLLDNLVYQQILIDNKTTPTTKIIGHACYAPSRNKKETKKCRNKMSQIVGGKVFVWGVTSRVHQCRQ
jgi:hypothetical protein